jgi:drug/metabolite transporter (DMT)-like permease
LQANNHFGMLASLLTTVFFSISILCAARTTKILGGISANFCRLAVAALFLGMWAHIFGKGLQGHGFGIFFVSGCIGYGIGDYALFESLPRIGARLSCLLAQCLAAPFGALIEWLWLGTSLTLLQIFYASLILAGVSIALFHDSPSGTSRRDHWIGTLFGMIAAFGQGFGAVLSRKAFRLEETFGENIDGFTASYQRIIGGLCVAFFLFIFLRSKFERRPENKKGNIISVWPWILGNALAGPAIGVSCYQWALKTTPTGIVLPIVAITPLVIIPMAYFMENERITSKSIVGALLAVLGVVMLVLKA